MRTDELVRKLAAEAAPVTRLAPVPWRLAVWTACTVAAAVAAVWAFGARQDLAVALAAPAFQVKAALLILTAITAAAGALLLSVPGAERTAAVRWLPLAVVAALVLWIAGELGAAAAAGTANWRIGAAWGCAAEVMAVGFVPGAVLFVMVRRAAPLRAMWAGLLALMAMGAVGALGTSAICPSDRSMHVLVWHVLPLIVIGAVGAAAGYVLLGWARRLR
ncbi:MAG: NrsF family protein [Vicinamibacterales bacterium]|nr:NrsF family protein [Vicinamibacterales bacterium]